MPCRPMSLYLLTSREFWVIDLPDKLPFFFSLESLRVFSRLLNLNILLKFICLTIFDFSSTEIGLTVIDVSASSPSQLAFKKSIP